MTLMETVPAFTGLLFSLACGWMLFPELISYVERKRGTPPPPPGFEPDLWLNKVLAQRGGTQWLGRLDQIIFFAAFWAKDAGLLAGAWLTFKVVSKWESWKYFGEMSKWWKESVLQASSPTLHSDLSNGTVSWLWLIGTSHATFVIGTGANIALALLGVFAGRLVQGAMS